MTQRKSTWRTFSIRSLLIAILLVACLLGTYQYRKRSAKPDLAITPADVAWATDHHIWKIDLSEQRNIYGVQIVVFEASGTTKRWLCRIGGDTLVDTTENPLLTVSANCEDGSVNGKLNYMGGASFTAENLLDGKSTSWAGTPVLNENYYYLVSDSQTIGGGKQPFEKQSNKLAIELLRSPR